MGTLVKITEYQPENCNRQSTSGKGCAGGKLLPLRSCHGELDQLFDNAFLLLRLPTSSQDTFPKSICSLLKESRIRVQVVGPGCEGGLFVGHVLVEHAAVLAVVM